MRKNEKRVVASVSRNCEKVVSGNRYSSNDKNPIWVFDDLDKSGKFAFDINRDDFKYKEFLSKMIDYSNMT